MKSKYIFSITFAMLLLCAFAFSQNLDRAARQKFKSIDFVTLPKGTFIIGEHSQSVNAKRTVDSFKINKYETTYEIWYSIRIQAEKLGYVFANPGQGGSSGRRGREPNQENYLQPVTMISWYDAIVWCNALSEIEKKEPCYTYNGKVLRDSSDSASCDLALCNWKANGYRLPTEAEWEYAARFSKTGIEKDDIASGQTKTLSEALVAWSGENTTVTRRIGTAGTVFKEDAPPAPASGNANKAGIFDMSGNVLEFCWDWFSSYKTQKSGERAIGDAFGLERVSRGGSWSPYTAFLCSGDRYSFDPNEVYNYLGFRICTK
ncbi:MAG: SUMF1/EgtB/PvdO family nonheme iron enzyme [Treponema sp.]|nr:SUMF1/EgtB/PvdO family nonheme iron enzyme [Treponema sp.]